MITSGKLIEFDEVDASLVSEARTIIDNALQKSEHSANPKFVHLCGIPGAGKTTYANTWLQSNQSFALVQFDGVMEQLVGYQSDKLSVGLTQAFTNWELPTRVIGYHLLQALVNARRNVLFDHSALSRTHVGLISALKAHHYEIEMHYLECSPELAKERVTEREKIIQRHTPERLIFERHELLHELLPIYKGLVNKFDYIFCDFSEEKQNLLRR